MEIHLPVTQLRTHIADILKRLRENPRIVYKITHHREVIAELKAPDLAGDGKPATSTEQEVTAFLDAFLTRGIPKKKSAYPRIRRLCRIPSERLPFKNLEETMKAIRGRGHGPG